ncbi:MAG: hypothetical protein HQ503_14945 [Rhodospirillales bacterium]|nr:hypothetical protein [Rhodospirillales bacterium]
MSDQIAILPDQPVPAVPSKRPEAFTGYKAGQEVKTRAGVSTPMDGSEFGRALTKLDKTMEDGAPLRRDVPRGYYLNIRV